jgi:hypothetical protein
MTTLRKLISEIDFNNKNVQDTPSWEQLSNLFNIFDLYWSEDERLKCYFIKKWYCTDSYVGLRAYFLDGEFVAISNQTGRKSCEDFTFTSLESSKKVRDYLLSLVDGENKINVDLLDDNVLDGEMPDTYKIEFNTQILHKTALLNGERVEIVKRSYRWDSHSKNNEKYFHTVEIKKADGKKVEVHVNELDFEYNV